MWRGQEFDCVFCDALSWTPSEAILTAACHSFSEVLSDGGLLLWRGFSMGAPPRDDEVLAIERYCSEPALEVEGPWTLGDGTHLTRLVCRELDRAGVIVHRAYVVTQGNAHRIELSSIGELTYWQWERIWGVLSSAGFARSETVESFVGDKKRLLNVTYK